LWQLLLSYRLVWCCHLCAWWRELAKRTLTHNRWRPIPRVHNLCRSYTYAWRGQLHFLHRGDFRKLTSCQWTSYPLSFLRHQFCFSYYS
jgi:hypothetical protein